eukprot:g7141.t1
MRNRKTNFDSPPDGLIEAEDTSGSTKPKVIPNMSSKLRSFKVRFFSTVFMISSFLFIIYMGHVPLVMLVLFIQWCMISELFNLAREAQKENQLPWFRAQQWYFFGVATFFFYLRFIKHNLWIELTSDAKLSRLFSWLLKKHSLISYILYTTGFMVFVLSLKKGMYLYQFGQYAWTHMILMIVFVPSSFLISNIFQGIIWFLLPCSLIIVNDITAYLGGFLFGRTPLIKLSPKKTWEGFIFGFIFTVLSSFILAKMMLPYDWMTCPRLDLSMGWITCARDEVFVVKEHGFEDLISIFPLSLYDLTLSLVSKLPDGIRIPILSSRFTFEPMLFHASIFAIFASVIAPFAGFFASGFKRAFRVKDFAGMIPGHGGMTDRMDCQTLMALFSYLYYFAFIREAEVDVPSILETILRLDESSQLEIFGKLGNYLIGEQLIPNSLSGEIDRINHLNEYKYRM